MNLSEGNRNHVEELYVPHVHSSIIYNNQDTETTKVFREEWIKKLQYICTKGFMPI